MSKLNKRVAVNQPTLQYNAKGNLQYQKSAKEMFVNIVTGALYGKDTFYKSNDEIFAQLKSVITDLIKEKGGISFAANAIIYARNELGMRNFPVLASVELIKQVREKGLKVPNLKSVVSGVIGRADQLTDIYAYCLSEFGKRSAIPLSIKRGVAEAFTKFDNYQLSKYKASRKEVTLQDVIRLVHPKPKNQLQVKSFYDTAHDELQTPITWETVLSEEGKKPESERTDKSLLWEGLIMEDHLPYMALLSNLRNIAQAGVSEQAINIVADRIVNEAVSQKFKQFPSKYYKALVELEKVDAPVRLISALHDALDNSADNIPYFGKDVLILLDTSGSMGHAWHKYGGFSLNPYEPGRSDCSHQTMLFAAQLIKASKGAHNLTVIQFSDEAKDVTKLVRPNDSIVTTIETLLKEAQNGGTNFESAVRLVSSKINRKEINPDVVFVLTDGEIDGLVTYSLPKLNSFVPQNALKFVINAAAASTSPFNPNQGWNKLYGYSDNIFKLIPMMKEGKSLIDYLSRDPFISLK